MAIYLSFPLSSDCCFRYAEAMAIYDTLNAEHEVKAQRLKDSRLAASAANDAPQSDVAIQLEREVSQIRSQKIKTIILAKS